MTEPDPKILCHCFHVTEEEIREVVEDEGLRRVSEVTVCTRAGGGCFSCWPEIEAILRGQEGFSSPEEGDADSRQRFHRKVEALLSGEIGTLLSLNRIRATLLDVEEDRVLIQFQGPWTEGRPHSFEVIRGYMEKKLSQIAGHKVELWEGSVGLDPETGVATL